ncbi:ribonucleoside-diphosphate reductase subunit alpha [Sulfuricaulis sp.]|uniref:ribonucleoside-diphosphate reductase subunit alpha n=1 Tax=Sulfuricaulis sp. TaxID=2003553 RepID=UPI0034A1B5BE
MHATSVASPSPPVRTPPFTDSPALPVPNNLHVIRRNGAAAHFDANKIAVAISKAFLAAEGGTSAASARVREIVAGLTRQVVQALTRRLPGGGTLHIEDIQDQVELALMRNGHHEVARRYVLYREKRAHARAAEQPPEPPAPGLNVRTANGELRPLDRNRLATVVREACACLNEVDAERVLHATLKNLFDGVDEGDVMQSAILSARALIETEPDYTYVTARLLLDTLRHEVLGDAATHAQMRTRYAEYFDRFVRTGVEAELLDPRLAEFDLARLGAALNPDRDLAFTYLGLQTLYDRYFLHIRDRRIELPQAFWMRVAMGLALNEIDRESRAIQFYEVLSSFDFVSSTPTLFNAGTLRSQLSSCYLTTVADDLDSIYGAIKDNALLSKYAGGLGNDWTRVRALGSWIKGTNGRSQGVIPFLKVANDTAVAVNQGGRRNGAVCAYLETWHLDIEEFLELRKNTGDDRRRTHDMNTANWIPDLFMQRVRERGEWTLFSPSDAPDLHDRYGQAFTEAYLGYEQKAASGELKLFKKIRAQDLWRKMLTMLFETGHPWLTFKDPCNVRSPQQHAGVVHSSNLCTEITLNTSDEEIAVCNLGSINLVRHLDPNSGLDFDKVGRTVRIALRMLDNVIDINYYAVPQARASNLRHRPVGLGLMGFQDALFKRRIPYASDAAVEFADETMEAIGYHAILASTELAAERGTYPSYAGSLWSQGILPIDSIGLLAAQRAAWDGALRMDRGTRLDWQPVREAIVRHGMRNSNCLAIAPTATISNIAGVGQSIEPTYQNLFVKSNLSGEFTVLNEYLVRDLKVRGLWDAVMVNDLKYFDGRVAPIDRIPEDLKALYATAFEIEPAWLIECASRRQKWIDQAQSLNLYMDEPSGKKLSEMYLLAWEQGLKTTYYLRTLGATAAEKSTIADGALNAVPGDAAPKACALDDPHCESCQ